MNKSDLIKLLAQERNISQKRADEVVNVLFDELTSAIATGERVNIRGLGSFMTRDYDSYTGRNPKTGESITVPPKKLPYFKVGKEVKESVLG
ncbi:MAG TPA: HU family DNA-binding protein [Desulfuromonadaceae bacterium]